MGEINIFNGSNKATLQYSGTQDVSINAEHLGGLTTDIQSQINTITTDNANLSNLINGTLSNNGVTIPSLASDPGSPTVGQLYWNTTDSVIKYYDGNEWKFLTQPVFQASGHNTSSTFGAYGLLVFTASGTLTVTNTGIVDILVVGGGGGGGGNSTSSGGGAGGLVWGEGLTIPVGTYPVVVGSGGSAGVGECNSGDGIGGKGGDSSIFGVTAAGGGAGIDDQTDFDQNRANGGCGAGSPSRDSATGLYGISTQQTSFTAYGSTAITGYGNRGGDSVGGSPRKSGSGGGAGARGYDGGEQYPATGGAGMDMSSFVGTAYGESGWFAGGGGSPYENNDGFGADGGQGGGGRAGANGTCHDIASGSAMANTGGGGGAGGYQGSQQRSGGNGGSGIVIIRYRL